MHLEDRYPRKKERRAVKELGSLWHTIDSRRCGHYNGGFQLELQLRSAQPFPQKGIWVAPGEGVVGMGDMGRKSARIQQLSQFALSDSLREQISNSLRKRRISNDGQDDDGARRAESRSDISSGNSGFRAVVLKPTRAKRSGHLETGPQVVRAGIDCEEKNGIRKEELRSETSNGNLGCDNVAVKLRSTRAKRSKTVGTGSQFSRPRRVTHLNCTVMDKEAVRKSALGDANDGDYKLLDASFFECDALELAPKLLGKLLRRDDIILQITEVEAYRPGDSACHARVGQTSRTAPLFGPPGHAYVYLCYGLHVMLNVVADSIGVGAAVLIRACSPVAGLSSIQLRRGQLTVKPVLLTGPGKVGQALGLTTEWTSHPLYRAGGLEILDAPTPTNILVGPRVGIDYAEPEHVAALWRFAIADNPWVSAPRATLKLLQQQ